MYIRSAYGYVKESEGAFTLVELLLVMLIIAILAVVVVLLINPLELSRRSRDSMRISDFDVLQKNINIVLNDAPGGTNVLCEGITPPCSGRSDTGTRVITGGGWIKINFSGTQSVTMGTLPVDPTNNEFFHYNYFSNGKEYELNTVLESEKMHDQSRKDGGDNDNVYEMGSSRTLLH